LYIYSDLQELQNRRAELRQALHQYHWYVITLQDTTDQFFEVVLALAEPSIQQPSIGALDRSLIRYIENGSPIQIAKFPGLTTLLRTAFINQPGIIGGTPLFALAEIIASVSDAWDYCAILIPKPTEGAKVEQLQVQECSSKFPPHLKDTLVEVEKPLAGWCYRHRQGIVVESAIENDPRIAFFEDEERPEAAAAFPAITAQQQVAGVIYVAKRPRAREKQVSFSEEVLASLQAFGYICGDMLARDQIEVETVRSMSQSVTRKLMIPFEHLRDMLQEVVDKVRRGVSPENVADSWVYLLALNIETTSQEIVTRWLRDQGIDAVGNFLAYKLWDPPHRDPILIGRYREGADRYVFAVLQAVYLPEEQYKQRITALQQELDQISLGKLIPSFYASAVTFRYGSLPQPVNDEEARQLVDDLFKRTEERLIAGPYFRRGHEALYNNDLDRAVSEFEDALRYASKSWYGYKHLAEARMLQGTEKSIKLAIEKCREALRLNPGYASAHCLLADCFSYQGKFSDAIIEYEKALAIDGTRLDFLTRYGQALAAMTTFEYKEALEQLSLREPKLVQQHKFLSQPWLEAIDKFGQVRKLSTKDDETLGGRREKRADYQYYRGYAYLQAGLITEAVEDFAVGRKLAPGNLQLAQAYLHALRLQRSRKGGE
jgi:tetratricopeptide (TPR) repeat protein